MQLENSATFYALVKRIFFKRKPVSIIDELGPLKFLLMLKQMFLAQIGWWANKFLSKVVKPKVNEIGNFCLTRR